MSAARRPTAHPAAAPAASGPSVRPAPSPVALRFDIRQLNLRGYTPAQQQRFVAALETALAQLAHARRAELSAGSDRPRREASRPDLPRLALRRLDLNRLDLNRAAADPVDAAQQLARRLFDRALTSGNGHG